MTVFSEFHASIKANIKLRMTWFLSCVKHGVRFKNRLRELPHDPVKPWCGEIGDDNYGILDIWQSPR